MVLLGLFVTIAFVAAALALAAPVRRLRRRVDQLERRLCTMEIEGGTTVVVEPNAPPRPPSQLLN